jgi:hypothetical protein
MTRVYLTLALIAAAFGAGWWLGAWTQESKHIRALASAQQAAMRAADLASAKEAARLAAETERDQLARQLEDAANAEPVTAAACLPLSRVLRLNRR